MPTLLHDEQEFRLATKQDPMRDVPGDQLLRGLRGKDVLLVFVESYGRTAVQGSSFSPGVDAVLADGDRQLAGAGFHSRSAFLTSPTFGALSWLAHSTLQSGLWVDGQQRYDALVTSQRLTLARLFARAGWRTVSDVPADTHYWPQGRFYGYDHFYDSRNVGYRGPRFGYPTMPDQFTFDALGRLELAPQHRHAGVRRDGPHLQPRAVVAHAPDGPGQRGRRRLGVRRDAGHAALGEGHLALPDQGEGGLRHARSSTRCSR